MLFNDKPAIFPLYFEGNGKEIERTINGVSVATPNEPAHLSNAIATLCVPRGCTLDTGPTFTYNVPIQWVIVVHLRRNLVDNICKNYVDGDLLLKRSRQPNG